MRTDADRAIAEVGKILKPLGFTRRRLERGYHEWQINTGDVIWGVCHYLSGPSVGRTLCLDLRGYVQSANGPTPVAQLSEQSVVSRQSWGDHVRMMSFFGREKADDPADLSEKLAYVANLLRVSFLPVIAEVSDSFVLQRAVWDGWLTGGWGHQGNNVVSAIGGDDGVPLWRRTLQAVDLPDLKRIRGGKTQYYTQLSEMLGPEFVGAGFDHSVQSCSGANLELWVLEHHDLAWAVELGGCNGNSIFDAEAYLGVNCWVRKPSPDAWTSVTMVNLASVCEVPKADFKQLFNYRNDLFDYRNDPSDPGNERWNRGKMTRIADLVERKLIPWLKAERDFKKLKVEQLHYIDKF